MSSLNSNKLVKRSKRESIYHLDTVEVVGSDKNEFTYVNLYHFSTYAISIRACRKQDRTDLEETHDEFCSSEVEIDARTGKNENADIIEVFDVHAVPSNKSEDSVKISWTPPNDPNGIILNYVVKKSLVDNPQITDLICVSLLNRENVTSQIIDKVKPGNYSFQIAAVSLAGPGNFTHAKFVYIESPSFFSLIASPSFLALLFLSIASAIAMIAYNMFKRNSTSEILSTFDNFDSDNELVRH